MDSGSLLLTYYGDDFTGSTDAMEALARAGIRTVLFLDPPSREELSRFPGVRAVGVAGLARSMSPEQMGVELPPIFERLRALAAPIVHYKICSTFDSSPEIGSIGRAIELGQRRFGSRFVPLVVGAPVLGRYCIFGNLFARSGLDSEPYRLDRHPTMSRHPITPMTEADLCVHLGRQSDRKIGLVDILKLTGDPDRAGEYLDSVLADGAEIVLFDVLDNRQLPVIGRLIWQFASPEKPLFSVGSSGIEYALVAYWRSTGQLHKAPTWTSNGPAERIVAVSGSCSPVTDRQIQWAVEHDFFEIRIETGRFPEPEQVSAEVLRAIRLGADALASGMSVIAHTSRGPDDLRLAGNRSEREARAVHRCLGDALGRILQGILEQSSVTRVAVCGGDTSGYVARRLGIEALEMIGPMAPGSPLCRTHAPGQAADGREFVFKGGQVGRPDFFDSVLRGLPASGGTM